MNNYKKAKMLIVDDEPHILEALSQLFDVEYQVLTASDGNMALTMFQHHPDIAIVISDQRMPGMKGVELLKNIKQISQDTMRILLTGYADLEAVLDSVNVGEVFRYVRKPWVPETLKSIVALAMASFMLRRQKAGKTAMPPKNVEEQKPVEPTLQSCKPEARPALPDFIEQIPTSNRRTDPPCFEEEFFKSNPHAHHGHYIGSLNERYASFEEEFFASFKEEVIAELKKFESFEEEFFAKLNAFEETLLAPAGSSIFERSFHGRSGKPKILIVDDEAKVLTSLCESLVSDFDVLSCTSADAALDILEKNAFIACIMTDMRMPQKSGAEFLEQAQSMAPLVPKILMTAYADMEDVVKLVNQGVLFRHVQKPWNGDKLLGILKDAVQECRKRVESGTQKNGARQALPLVPTERKEAPVFKTATIKQSTSDQTMERLKRLSEIAREK
jgi:response regulator RpfG family c-di-GMP phosphodiesterase